MSRAQCVLITGARGQLGHELQITCPAGVRLIATDSDTLDITDAGQIEAALRTHQPDVVINSAAYTAVDKAETDQEQAQAINATAPGLLAQAIARRTASGHPVRLVHISTDFVFDGQASQPYTTDAPTAPLGVYGLTKRDGEQAILQHLPEALIVRTSWLYSTHGNNFVKSMLRLMQEKDQLGIVYDQIGSPTWARTLASTVWTLIQQNTYGILHCSDNGVASWYDFAVAIQEEAKVLGLLDACIPVRPIRSSAYPTPARRPAYSVMDKSLTEQTLGTALPYWRNSLRAMLTELKPLITHA